MKIATLNIDWARKLKRPGTEAFINQFAFDILVITEGIDLNLPHYGYKYLCDPIPHDVIYEGLNYTAYLGGETAYRTIVYSKYPFIRYHKVNAPKTALAFEIETSFGNIIIYATIVGTQFRKQPYAEIELENMINDCRRIHQSNQNIIIIGDLNTSFRYEEKSYTINTATTAALTTLFNDLGLIIPTNVLTKNIDHIVIPRVLESIVNECKTFIEKDIVSDHMGVCIELSEKQTTTPATP